MTGTSPSPSPPPLAVQIASLKDVCALPRTARKPQALAQPHTRNKSDIRETCAFELQVVAKNAAENNSFYLLWAGAIVFLMQAGFATLSAGSIRQKNVKNILCVRLSTKEALRKPPKPPPLSFAAH